MTPTPPNRLEAKPTNPDAFEFNLGGRYRAGRWNEADLNLAIDLPEQSVALDRDFGPAQALLGHAYGEKAFDYDPDDPQWIDKGYAAVEKALAGYRPAIAARPELDEAWHERGHRPVPRRPHRGGRGRQRRFFAGAFRTARAGRARTVRRRPALGHAFQSTKTSSDFAL